MDIDKAIEYMQDNKYYINNQLLEDDFLEAIDLIIKEGAEQSNRIAELETALIDENLKYIKYVKYIDEKYNNYIKQLENQNKLFLEQLTKQLQLNTDPKIINLKELEE